MIQLFKKNDFSHIVILFPYTVLLRLHSLLYPERYTADIQDGIFNSWIFNELLVVPLAQSIVGIVLIYAQSLMINIVVNQNRILKSPSALPGLVYVLLMSAITDFQGLNPLIVAVTFVVMASFNVLSVYKKTNVPGKIFNSSFLIGFASVVYMPFLILFITNFIGILSLRNFNLRERIQYVVGLLVVYWLMGSFLYYFDQFGYLNLNTFSWLGSIHLFQASSVSELVFLLVLGLLSVVSAANYFNFLKKKGIDVRKKVVYFYWFAVCLILTFFLFHGLGNFHFAIFCVPLSVFLGMLFLDMKNSSLAELLHLLLLIGILYGHFGEVLGLNG